MWTSKHYRYEHAATTDSTLLERFAARFFEHDYRVFLPFCHMIHFIFIASGTKGPRKTAPNQKYNTRSKFTK